MKTKPTISHRLTFVNSVSQIVVRVLSVTGLIWMNQYLIRRITPEEYSLLPVIYALMQIAPLATTILTAGMGRHTMEAFVKDGLEGPTRIASTLAPLLLGVSILMLALGGVTVRNIAFLLDIDPGRLSDARWMLGLLVGSMALRLATLPFQTGFFVQQRFTLSSGIQLGRELLRVLLLAGLLIGVGPRVLLVVVATATADVVANVISFFVSRRLLPTLVFQRSRFDWSTARSVCSYGGWAGLLTIANTIRLSADPIILNRMASALDVAMFHLGSLAPMHFSGLLSRMRESWKPVVTAFHAAGEDRRLGSAFLRGGRYNLWLGLGGAVPLMVFGRELMVLYAGEAYAQSGVVMQLLLGGMALGLGTAMTPMLSEATAEMRPYVSRSLVVQVANLGLTLLLVGYYNMGALGSAASTFVTIAILDPVLLWSLGKRLGGVSYAEMGKKILVPGCVPGLICAGFLIGLRSFVTPTDWLTLGLCFLLGFVVYGLALLAFCLLPEDRILFDKASQALAERVPRASRILGWFGTRQEMGSI